MRTFEYRLRPNRTQEQALWTALNNTRDLYNEALQELIDHYKDTGKHLNLFAQDKLHGKNRHPNISAYLVDTTLARLHRSFANFFRGLKEGKRVGFPRFKSANRWHTLQFRDAVHTNLAGCYFKAGKIFGGRIRFNQHRPLEGKLKFCRIIHRLSGWYLQCICEVQDKPLPSLSNAIGIDMGITHLVADSDGGFVKNPGHLAKSAERLAKAQCKLSKCRKGSNRRRKAARKVARIHEKIANQRKDFLHKLSRRYVNNYQTIAIEDLYPMNMVQNHRMARVIYDASWGMFRQILADKAASAGRELIAVSPHYTSQKCSQCGEMVQKSLSVRTHLCPHCGYIADRDTNAARNILAAGLKARTEPSLRTGEGSGKPDESPGSLKREATRR